MNEEETAGWTAKSSLIQIACCHRARTAPEDYQSICFLSSSDVIDDNEYYIISSEVAQLLVPVSAACLICSPEPHCAFLSPRVMYELGVVVDETGNSTGLSTNDIHVAKVTGQQDDILYVQSMAISRIYGHGYDNVDEESENRAFGQFFAIPRLLRVGDIFSVAIYIEEKIPRDFDDVRLCFYGVDDISVIAPDSSSKSIKKNPGAFDVIVTSPATTKVVLNPKPSPSRCVPNIIQSALISTFELAEAMARDQVMVDSFTASRTAYLRKLFFGTRSFEHCLVKYPSVLKHIRGAIAPLLAFAPSMTEPAFAELLLASSFLVEVPAHLRIKDRDLISMMLYSCHLYGIGFYCIDVRQFLVYDMIRTTRGSAQTSKVPHELKIYSQDYSYQTPALAANASVSEVLLRAPCVVYIEHLDSLLEELGALSKQASAASAFSSSGGGTAENLQGAQSLLFDNMKKFVTELEMDIRESLLGDGDKKIAEGAGYGDFSSFGLGVFSSMRRGDEQEILGNNFNNSLTKRNNTVLLASSTASIKALPNKIRELFKSTVPLNLSNSTSTHEITAAKEVSSDSGDEKPAYSGDDFRPEVWKPEYLYDFVETYRARAACDEATNLVRNQVDTNDVTTTRITFTPEAISNLAACLGIRHKERVTIEMIRKEAEKYPVNILNDVAYECLKRLRRKKWLRVSGFKPSSLRGDEEAARGTSDSSTDSRKSSLTFPNNTSSSMMSPAKAAWVNEMASPPRLASPSTRYFTSSTPSPLSWQGGGGNRIGSAYSHDPPTAAVESAAAAKRHDEHDTLSQLEITGDDIMCYWSRHGQALGIVPSTKNSKGEAAQVSPVYWEDIGGLDSVRRDVLEIIQLPLQRPELFPIGCARRRGILLYGPPGTGKTLVAKAVATECNMSFISVKGPELLDTYVGESEKNIRAAFAEARNQAPSVLFFDELDSLAPKRSPSAGGGGGGSGVMDRVVSQLLIEMDRLQHLGQGRAAAASTGTRSRGGGVSSHPSGDVVTATIGDSTDTAGAATYAHEEVKPIEMYVMGATNRPDLLDTALLRPGRFDHKIYLSVCKSAQSCSQILRAQTRKFKLRAGVNIDDIACWLLYGVEISRDSSSTSTQQLVDKPMKPITGADVYAIASSAYSNALQRKIADLLSRPKAEPGYASDLGNTEDRTIVVETDDFVQAIAKLVPSVTEEELRHYEDIGRTFSSVA